MIFKIHYFSFNAGLSGVLLFISVFLRKYSDASSTEIGTLLMILPFLSVITKPFFCALADRHQKYKLYFTLSLLVTLIGFGSYTILPFFPDFYTQHGRLAWWYLVCATVLGQLGYGVVWSLGDACAANLAHRTGQSFGQIRLWGTVGWGVAGAFVGATGPYLPQLPEMVLGFIVFVVTHVFELILLAFWSDSKGDFEMGAGADTDELGRGGGDEDEKKMPADSLAIIKLNCGDEKKGGDSRACLENQLMMQMQNGALAGAKNKPPPLTTQLSLSLSAAEFTEKIEQEERKKRISELQWTIFKMVARKHASIFKYLLIFTAVGAIFNIHFSYFFLHLEQIAAEHLGRAGQMATTMEGGVAEEPTPAALQLIDFSTLVGMCVVAQSVGETFCFVIAPWVLSKLGRDGAISLNLVAYVMRYLGNGLGIPLLSPFVAILTESLQGINYGIFYYLITDTALHYALQVDDIIPELVALGKLAPETLSSAAELRAVRTSLRATMQGVFSGAFDGLGFGLGSIIAGLVLERHTYEQLWCFTGGAALAMFALHALYELAARLARKSRQTSGGGGGIESPSSTGARLCGRAGDNSQIMLIKRNGAAPPPGELELEAEQTKSIQIELDKTLRLLELKLEAEISAGARID